MEDNKLSIRVNVADRFYPLKVEADDEEKIRKAAKMINEKILQYKTKYNDKDIQDFLAMAALQFVTKLIEFDAKEETANLMENLHVLHKELDEYIKKEAE